MADLTTAQLTELADNYQSMAKQLMQYKLSHLAEFNSVQVQDMTTRVSLLLHNSNLLTALSTFQAVQDLKPHLASIKQSTADLQKTLDKIKKVQEAIDIATIVVNLGSALVTQNFNKIAEHAAELAAAVKG